MPPLTQITLADLKQQADRLPKMPEVALQLNRLLHNPKASAESIGNVLRLDSRMTAEVLRLCNSAAYGLKRRILTVKEAVAMLGTNAIVSMVYAILSKSTLDKPVKGYGLEAGQLFKSGLTGAVYAKHLAKKLKTPVDGELAFTGAILRDIGKLLLSDFVGEHYPVIEALAQRDGIGFADAEKAVLGLSHIEAGHYLAKLWELPDPLVKCVRYKNQPSALPKTDPFYRDTFPLVTSVHLADLFTKMAGVGIGVDGLMVVPDAAAVELLPVLLTETGADHIMADLLALQPAIDDLLDSITKATHGEGNP
ncbi:MAG: HDOD domain-containing protein [Vampirovibrionales bacterium]|nr:HDOD domain-containing protein [Vampirovibrionales bacterium]